MTHFPPFLPSVRRWAHTAYVRTKYTEREIDAVGIYSPDLDECLLVPITELAGRTQLALRVGPTGGCQAQNVR